MLEDALTRSRLGRAALIGWHFAQARRRWAALRRGGLAAYQDERMRRVTALARRQAPFYRQHWAGHDPAAWRDLPTVDKRLMMEHFSDFNTRGVAHEQAMRVALEAEQRRDFLPTVGGLTVGLSSGTSGHRGLFLVGPGEQAAWAGTVLARTLHRLRREPYRVAFFLRSNSNLYEQLGGRLVRLRYFDLMLPLERAIRELNALQPDIVVGPPSLLGLLAGELGGSLRIAPGRLIAVAEVLEPQDQRRLRDAFGAPVHQIYQCTEGLIAISCAHGALHIQEDIVAVQCEPLPGDPARVTPVVSDLWRTVQPIVRYRLNDVLTLDPAACPCGSPFRVIASIEGRCDDVFQFPDAAGAARPVFPDLVRRMILLASPEIEDYQATQDCCGQIEVRLATRPGADWATVAQATRQSVLGTLAEYGCAAHEVAVTPGLLPLPAGAKRRRVWRNC